MKKTLTAILAAAGMFLAGCATPYPQGSIYTQVKLPIAATDAKIANMKCGVSECTSILGIVATGDASIGTATKMAGITVIHHVDWEAESILGFIGHYRCRVYGE